MKKLLNTRPNIYLLVSTFYEQVQRDEMLGPIFNSMVKNWPEHIERLTDFWETNLLFTRNYKGNPLQVHHEVDNHHNNSISMEHFGRWLQLWYATIDAHFYGEGAENAKIRARKMSTVLFMKLFEYRSAGSTLSNQE